MGPKLCRMIEGFIDAGQEVTPELQSEFVPPPMEISGWDVAANIRDIVIRLEDDIVIRLEDEAKLGLKKRHKILKKKAQHGNKKEAKAMDKKESASGRFHN